MQSSTEPFDSEQSISLRETIKPYLRKWPWFIVSFSIFILGALIYLRYTPLSYQTTASILIKDEQSSDLSQMAIFSDLGMGQLNSVNLENEIKILKSRPLTKQVVDQLNLNIQYYNEGRLRTTELYENSPIKLEVLSPEEAWAKDAPTLYITPKSLTSYEIKQEDVMPEMFDFGEEITYQGIDYIVQSNQQNEASFNEPISVRINAKRSTIDSYRNSLMIAADGKQSSIINIQLTSAIPDKARAVIDELIRQFNLDAIADKNMVSKNTAEFIDERLHIIWEELDSVETGKVTYKEENRLVDLQKEGELFLENANDFNQRLLAVQTEWSQVNAMINYLESGSKSSLLPANLGIAGDGLISLIQQYNQLVLERNQLLANTTETHPTIVTLTEQLSELKANILQSLNNLKKSLDISLADLKKQERYIGRQLASIPLKEKDFTNIQRQQEIKQTLYLYLLQKREETSIALAVTEPKAKIVDTAYTPIEPVAPKKKIVLLASFLLGGLIPFGFIYLQQLLDNKVRRITDITGAILNASVLGEIPKMNEGYELIDRNDLGMIAESFRVLRSNMQFAGMMKSREKGKVVLVTSSIKGEGKTTISSNLALTLSYTGQKVLLIGADIRSPKLHKFFHKNKKNHGLVNYIMDETSKTTDFILPSGISENLDILHSGTIPPNPEEFLMNDRLDAFLEIAKQSYDFIILDTAPTLLVNDTLLLSEKADTTLYVVRAGHTELEVLNFAKGLKEEGKLKKVHFILNNVSQANYGYGGKYGYGYGYGTEEPKGFFDKIRKGFS